MNGFLCIDKPAGPSSFGVVKKIKSVLRVSKIGHSGTLDPEATGLLVCAIGNATRLLSFLDLEPKTYLFSVIFGKTTDTLDSTGKITEQNDRHPSLPQLEKTLSRFSGTLQQMPPRFSAVKIHGTPAYKLARKERSFELKPRSITLYELTLLDYDPDCGHAQLKVKCSGGTYVRSLARDIGHQAETVAYADSIRRTDMGQFTINDACSFASIDEMAVEKLIPIHTALSSYPSYRVSPEETNTLRHGINISIPLALPDTPNVFAYNSTNNIIAVLNKISDNQYHPDLVFNQP